MKDVLGSHLKDPLFFLVHLLSITPITAKDQSRIHQFGKKVLPGLFLGYALYAGGIWKGDVLIADLEELETMDASGNLLKKTQCGRGDISQTRRIYFSNSRWDESKTPGEDQELKTSTLIRHRPIQGEGHIDFLGELEGSFPQLNDSLPVAGEAMHDFWSMSGSFIYRHHVEPRVELYSAERRIIPYSTEVH